MQKYDDLIGPVTTLSGLHLRFTALENWLHLFCSLRQCPSAFSPAASPEILHHTEWRTWLFHSLLRWKMIILPVLTTTLIHFSLKGWENVLFWTWEWKGLWDDFQPRTKYEPFTRILFLGRIQTNWHVVDALEPATFIRNRQRAFDATDDAQDSVGQSILGHCLALFRRVSVFPRFRVFPSSDGENTLRYSQSLKQCSPIRCQNLLENASFLF